MKDRIMSYNPSISHYRRKLIADCKRDEKFFTFWVDNCSAQNKNWTLYTALFQVNDVNTNCERITIRYFEPGHTFMAADSFHAKVEDEKKRVKNVYDFKDIKSVIDAQGQAVKMQIGDFREYQSKLSKTKDVNYPRLVVITKVEFKKGNTSFFWKDDTRKTSFTEAYFLQKKFIKAMNHNDLFPVKSSPRGITIQKKRYT